MMDSAVTPVGLLRDAKLYGSYHPALNLFIPVYMTPEKVSEYMKKVQELSSFTE